ncbi:AAA family ATPase [Oceanispirochaeta sp. M1]|uniref:AAA family ATPase n=1 Tax=unclassified Oceanispirochaeta TaxID=2635722 RepID=UPI0021040B5E|nr:AAA family ATPase [Oceanispirochaeta sp. M1]
MVEEPEQNLSPGSQWDLLKKSLLKENSRKDKNQLIMTTHSPYILSYMNLALQASSLWERIDNKDLEYTLTSIIPKNISVKVSNLNVYECNETDGSIKKLEPYEGILPDDNYLNKGLREGNDLFDALLDIEDQL